MDQNTVLGNKVSWLHLFVTSWQNKVDALFGINRIISGKCILLAITVYTMWSDGQPFSKEMYKTQLSNGSYYIHEISLHILESHWQSNITFDRKQHALTFLINWLLFLVQTQWVQDTRRVRNNKYIHV